VKQVKLDTLEGRARLASLAKPHLDKLREGPLRALIVDELARLTRLSRADLEAALVVAARSAVTRPAGETTRAETPGAKPVRRALQLLLDQPALASGAEHLGQLALLSQPGIDVLVDALEFFREHPEANAAQLIERERGTPRGAALERVSRLPMDTDDVAAMAAEFRDCLQLLRRRALRERQQALLDTARERSLSLAEQGELLELLEIQKSLVRADEV
jgi:DNA primase